MVFYLGVLLVLAAATLLALGYWVSGMLVHGRRLPVIRTLSDCGLDYEDASFLSWE
jgi:hypothetical protein